MGHTYYVDGLQGLPGRSGLSPEEAVSSWRDLTIEAGDRLLFRRGSLFRDVLEIPCGRADAPMYCGAYGEGEKPVFCGSISAGDPAQWRRLRENIWEFTDEMTSEPGNIIFENDECGVLAWEESDLTQSDRWHYTAIAGDMPRRFLRGSLLMYSIGNPALRHSSIEIALYGSRHMVSCRENAVFEDIAFINSAVHGYGDTHVRNVTFRRCDFRMIGGIVWSKELKVRFGNGIECWNSGENVLVEGCLFDQIYDSCVTHQGPGEQAGLAVNIAYIGNTFKNFGMAAYEARDRVGINVRFENNVCMGAGEGFSLQDETPPRRSEIWPQPMGHHIFLWRITHAEEGGSVRIANNTFGSSPYGAAVYSIIAPEGEAQFERTGNTYQKDTGLLIRWSGENFTAEQLNSRHPDTL